MRILEGQGWEAPGSGPEAHSKGTFPPAALWRHLGNGGGGTGVDDGEILLKEGGKYMPSSCHRQ